MDRGSPILRFYAGTGTDNRGRTLALIQGWDNDRLEQVHDYIQWLFPLPEASAFNWSAPVLTAEDIAVFRASDPLRQALLASFRRLLEFYGFVLEESGAAPVVSVSADHAGRAALWVTRGNHNFLRITRILRSLHLLGLPAEAAAFLTRLQALYDGVAGRIIGPTTLRYWRDALAEPPPPG
jgi:hypothetical protein